jgi:hypothetical protein
MAQPVWVLSVDLQAKTATFQSGMAEAAKSARGAFTEIKSGSGEAGEAVGRSMGSARQGVMLLGEEFGVHLPRGLTMFISSLGPVGAAMEAAFPFIAILLGATLLLEHLSKLHAEGQKLTDDQMKFGTAAQNAFNQFDQHILQAQIRSDELRNDHLGALRHQLELIDKQSMGELVRSFEEVAKSADVVFADLKTSWYQFGTGSAGAKHALDQFQTQYDDLLAKGKDKEASDLLAGTRDSAQKILAMQSQLKAAQKGGGDGSMSQEVAKQKYEEAALALKKAGVGATEKEVEAQQTLVDALSAQLGLEGKVAQLRALDKNNATTTTGKEMGAQQAEGARAAAEHQQKMGEIAVGAAREQAQSLMEIQQASIGERLVVDEMLANKEYAIQMAGNQALVAALDKGGKDYNNQLRGLQEKAEELTAQHEANLSNLKAKADEAQSREDLQNLVQSEREKIEATLQGSRERLTAIDAAIKEEQSKNLQATSNYRDLLKQRVETQRQATEEEAKLSEQAGKEEAENAQKMGELELTAAKQHQAMMDSLHRVSAQQRGSEEIANANQEYTLKRQAMQQEAAALDKDGKDYENKRKAIQNKELQLTKEHENEVTQIKQKAEEERNAKILSAENQFNDTIARGLTQVLMGHKSFASMMNSIGNEVVTGAMQNALKMIEANLLGKESDAAKAARTAYNIGLDYGGPAGMALGPVFAAIAFSTMSGFQSGTDRVPGIGPGDKVPAMLEPGEGVVPGGVMDGLRSMARNGGMGGGTQYHAHSDFKPTVHALDADGVDKVLEKHGAAFQKHVEGVFRKLNR